jgi:hypothetical protein
MSSRRVFAIRCYISAALLHGQSDKASKLSRLPAAEIEQLIAAAVRKHLGTNPSHGPIDQAVSITDKELISTHVVRVDVGQTVSSCNWRASTAARLTLTT